VIAIEAHEQWRSHKHSPHISWRGPMAHNVRTRIWRAVSRLTRVIHRELVLGFCFDTAPRSYINTRRRRPFPLAPSLASGQTLAGMLPVPWQPPLLLTARFAKSHVSVPYLLSVSPYLTPLCFFVVPSTGSWVNGCSHEVLLISPSRCICCVVHRFVR